jgi:hypothetical protein
MKPKSITVTRLKLIFTIGSDIFLPYNRQNNSCYFAAMLSISTNAPFGNALTAIAERAGKSPSKYLA